MRPGGNPRIAAVDLARAVAVVGMVVFNFRWMLDPEDIPAPLEFFGEHLAGRFAVLFVLLSGVSISLAARSVSAATMRRRLGRRAVALAALGMALAALWPNDILHFYAVYLVVAIGLLRARTSTLLAVASVFVVGSVGLHTVLDHNVGWDWDEQAAYAALFVPSTLLRHLLFNGLHSLFPWGAFLLVGMVVGRQNLRSHRVQLGLGVVGLWSCVAGEAAAMVVSAAVEPFFSPQWLVDMGSVYAWPSMFPFVLSALGFSLIGLAVAGWIVKRWGDAPVLAPAFAVGRTALSLYVLHAVAGVIVLARSDLFSVAYTRDVVTCSALFLGPALVLATYWDSRRGGPLERLLRQWSMGPSRRSALGHERRTGGDPGPGDQDGRGADDGLDRLAVAVAPVPVHVDHLAGGLGILRQRVVRLRE